MKNPRDIIFAPVVSEKTYDLIENNNTYTLGTQNIAVNDNFRRLLLRSVIELRN